MSDITVGHCAVVVREGPAGPVVEVAGELDMDSAPLLASALNRALAAVPVPPVLVVDLADVTFCDSAGLNALLLARRKAGRAGAVVRLARPTPAVARLLEITGADRVFPVDRADAADVPPARLA